MRATGSRRSSHPRPHLSRAPRRRAAAAAAVGTAALLLTGCGAAATSTSSGGSAAVVDGAVAPQPAYAGGTAAEATKDGSARTADLPGTVTVDRSVVVVADTSVRVTDVLAATGALSTIAARYSASVASQVSSRGDGLPVPMPAADEKLCSQQGTCPQPVVGYASSTTSLRLDNDKVDALLRDVAALGTVEASSRSSADVTAEVADIDARVSNAQASLARVRALMGKATSIGDIVALEGELSRRQADLEALQARQRTLADQTAQATVTVRLYSADAPAPEAEQSGFLAGLSAGWSAFTGALVVALTVLGALVPFLLVLVPIALVVRLVVRRSRRTPPSAPAPAES
jgi:hypothetical protein